VFRSSRNIALTLLGSAALFGCCFTSCVRCDDLPERDANGNEIRDANGNVIYRHHCRYHPLGGSTGHGYTFWHGSPYSHTASGYVSGGGGSRSSPGTTSRGGFGTTGHATSGG
jgi:hypothetical protein